MSSFVYSVVKLSACTLYPAYSSFKAVHSKNVKDYVRWMMYWIVFALFLFIEALTDLLLSWLPFYCELKICFLAWLIAPMTNGSSLLYRKLVHPQLVKREPDIDSYVGRVRDQGYQALIGLGARGFTLATHVVLTTAIKGSDQLKRSLSLTDISMDESDLRMLRRLGSTTSLDSLPDDELDIRAEQELAHVQERRRPHTAGLARRSMDEDEMIDNLDNNHDLPTLLQRSAERRSGQRALRTKLSESASVGGPRSQPATPSTASSHAYNLSALDRYLRSASLDTTTTRTTSSPSQSTPSTPSPSFPTPPTATTVYRRF